MKQVVVVYNTLANINSPHTIKEDFKVHGHEEADTLIPLHVLDSLHDKKFKEIHVWSPDTDVFIFLIDRASNDRLAPLTQLKFCTGVGAKYRELDVRSCVQVIG